MSSKLPEPARLAYARQLADEAKTLVPGMERLSAIAEELRADDLYRLLGFDTWERFCADYLGVAKSTANRWIAGQKAKSIGAGQRVAAAQNAPVVESKALNSAKPSAGSGPGMPQTRPGVAAPADPSSGGADVQPPAGPTEAPSPLEEPSPSAPPDPPKNPTGRVPSLRQEASAIFGALHEATEGIGAKWTVEEATYWENRTKREMDAWRAAHGLTPKPERRQGTITRPADRAPKPPIKVNGAPVAGSLTRRTVEPMFKKA